MAAISALITRLKTGPGIGGIQVENIISSSFIEIGFSSEKILFIRFRKGFTIWERGPSASSTTFSFSVLAFTLITGLSYTFMDTPGKVNGKAEACQGF